MRLFFYMFLFILPYYGNGLIFNGGRGYNYERQFISNKKNVDHELTSITHFQALSILNIWFQHIQDIESINSYNKKTVMVDGIYDNGNYHIIQSINMLHQNLESNPKRYFLAWTPYLYETNNNPKNKKYHYEILFIIVYEVVQQKNNECVNIETLVQSPFWCEEQIPSKKLKEILEHYFLQKGFHNIKFDKLYAQNIRYSLEWSFYDYNEE